MKHKIWTNYLLGAVFAFVLSVSTVGNLVTGYDLKVRSLLMLFLWCAGCSLISALLFRFKYGETVLLFVTVLLSWNIMKRGMLWEQLQSLAYLISAHYHDVYDWPVIGKPLSEVVSLPLMVLSAWAAFSVSWCVCRREHIVLAAPPVVLPLMICMITTDRVPDPLYLYLLIVGVALLLITDWSRQNHPAQGIKLTCRLAIPVAAAVALLFLTNPKDTYVNHVGEYQKEVVSWFRKFQDTAEYISSGAAFEFTASEKLNLNNVGPKSKLSYSVMRVRSPIDGTIYLRGRDYDQYFGTGWASSGNRNELFSSGSTSCGELIIVTYGVRDVLYVPYYANREIKLVNGSVSNDENLQRYTYSLCRLPSRDSGILDPGYTDLPTETLQWISNLDLMMEIADLPINEKIKRIEIYVENSAIYDLSTPKMRSEHHDFAQWFLTESDRGYCVHFATAATVLLRGAGIPARYVEGYMVTCTAGEDVVVSSQDAHAWAEYYDSESGAWKILEATPADPSEEEETEIALGAVSEGTEPHVSATESGSSETAPADSENAATMLPEDVEQPIIQESMPDHMDSTTANTEIFQIPEWLKTVFWSMIVIILIPIQCKIRMEWKQKQWNSGKANEKAVYRWKQTKNLARLLGEPFPEVLDHLAQKAIFSQHRIQFDELQLFEDYRKALLDAVSSKPWYHRVLLRLIFAIGS